MVVGQYRSAPTDATPRSGIPGVARHGHFVLGAASAGGAGALDPVEPSSAMPWASQAPSTSARTSVGSAVGRLQPGSPVRGDPDDEQEQRRRSRTSARVRPPRRAAWGCEGRLFRLPRRLDDPRLSRLRQILSSDAVNLGAQLASVVPLVEPHRGRSRSCSDHDAATFDLWPAQSLAREWCMAVKRTLSIVLVLLLVLVATGCNDWGTVQGGPTHAGTRTSRRSG